MPLRSNMRFIGLLGFKDLLWDGVPMDRISYHGTRHALDTIQGSVAWLVKTSSVHGTRHDPHPTMTAVN